MHLENDRRHPESGETPRDLVNARGKLTILLVNRYDDHGDLVKIEKDELRLLRRVMS